MTREQKQIVVTFITESMEEPAADDAKTAQQKAYVKESLYRALDEVERAKRGEHKMMTEEEFLEGLKKEGIG